MAVTRVTPSNIEDFKIGDIIAPKGHETKHLVVNNYNDTEHYLRGSIVGDNRRSIRDWSRYNGKEFVLVGKKISEPNTKESLGIIELDDWFEFNLDMPGYGEVPIRLEKPFEGLVILEVNTNKGIVKLPVKYE